MSPCMQRSPTTQTATELAEGDRSTNEGRYGVLYEWHHARCVQTLETWTMIDQFFPSHAETYVNETTMTCSTRNETPHVPLTIGGLPNAMIEVWSATWFRVGIRCSRRTHHRRLQTAEFIEWRFLSVCDVSVDLAHSCGNLCRN